MGLGCKFTLKKATKQLETTTVKRKELKLWKLIADNNNNNKKRLVIIIER